MYPLNLQLILECHDQSMEEGRSCHECCLHGVMQADIDRGVQVTKPKTLG